VKSRTKSTLGRTCSKANEWLARKPQNRLLDSSTAGMARVETSPVIAGIVKLKE